MFVISGLYRPKILLKVQRDVLDGDCTIKFRKETFREIITTPCNTVDIL